jgi:Na+/H+ antiporter NhaC
MKLLFHFAKVGRSFLKIFPFRSSQMLCVIMAVIALLVGRSQSFANPHFVLSMSSTRASNS